MSIRAQCFMTELYKNMELTAHIDGYSSSGDGVARYNGCVIFVKGALRGERCKILILKTSRSVSYAKILEIIVPSPHRITPACSGFGKCGGCDFLHMDYSEELELKRQRVEDALRRVGGFDICVPPVIASDLQSGYRNKAIYAIGEGKNGAFAGFYRERSHDIIPAGQCLIQADVSYRAANAVTRWMNRYKLHAYNEKNGSGSVRRVFCRFAGASKTAQITVVTADDKIRHMKELTEMILTECPETASIILNINKTRGNTVLSGYFITLWGSDTITDELCSLKYRLSPLSFYQINREQAERLYEKVLEFSALDPKKTVLDLYCGTGTITLLLARYAKHVTGAEIVEDAVSDARINAQFNDINNVRFICADASGAASDLLSSGEKPDTVVVDPPRRGLQHEVITAIAGMSPERIVYVSCDPATLARDLKLFSTLGYPPEEVVPVDMFPRCAHVETCVLLSREKL